jgi:DDE superfamily endonuclease
MRSCWIGFDSWMAERDPDFITLAVEIMELQITPPTDGPTFNVDEKTAIGVRTRTAASQPPAPGHPARREHEYVRHGTVDVLAACCVTTGVVTGIVRTRHRSEEFIELLTLVQAQVPAGEVIHLILDPVRMHYSAKVVDYLATQPGRFRCHWLPVHGSWLSFIEAWFAILTNKCLKRAELASVAEAEAWITGFIRTYNAHHAKPFTLKKGVKFYQRLKDKLAQQQARAPTALPAAAAPLVAAA